MEKLNSEPQSALLDKAIDTVFEQYDSDEMQAEDVSKQAIELGKRHVETVWHKAKEFGEFVGLDEHQQFLVELSATLHDSMKFSAERKDWRERLLLHAHDSVLLQKNL